MTKKPTSKIDDFQLPSWLDINCPYCKHSLPKTSVLSIGVDTSIIFFGDLCVSYVCEKCDSLCEMHFVGAFKKMPDLGYNPDVDEKPVTRESIINRTCNG